MKNKETNLYEASKNCPLKITEMPPHEALLNIGLRCFTNVKVITRYALGGPLLLKVEDSYLVAVGKDIAREIMVVEVASEQRA